MYTIGEFSRLSQISPRMLRHYDAIGLLRPAHVGPENGYRYYDAAQLSVLLKAERLKRYGFLLAEISDLLSLSEQELAKRIHRKRLKAYAELTEMRTALRQMGDDIIRMEGTSLALDNYHVIVMENPAQRVFGIRKTISVSQIHELFEELYGEIEKRGLKRTGAAQLLCHGEEFCYEAMDTEAQVEVGGNHPDIKELPARTMAAVTHVGPYETLKYAYDALCAWLSQHSEYQACGPAIERYLKGEGMAKSPEEYETGVLFPIKKKG